MESREAKEAWSQRGRGEGSSILRLTHLSHAVVAPGVEERLRIELRDIHLPGPAGGSTSSGSGSCALEELRCKAYVGPAAALLPGPDGRPDKSRLRETRLEVSGHQASAEVDLGVPEPQEPWALRMKLYRRPASNLFAQEKCSEFVEALPCPRCLVQLPGPGPRPGNAQVEVVRLVPASAAHALQEACGRVLAQAVDAGIEAADVEKLCLGARELGPDTLRSAEAQRALQTAAKLGKHAVVEKLLAAGVQATLAAARAAEQAHERGLARALFVSAEGTGKSEVLLGRALEERMPFVAEQILKEDAGALTGLPATGEAARKAHAAGAWSVLAALLNRGDPMPAPPRLLLDYALRAGHAGLARSCLAHLGEDTRDMELALRTCLDHGRTEIVREALEVMWKARSNEHSEGPPLLELEAGAPDHPAECSVCFEELYTNPGVFVNESGLRVCGHFTCLNCAEHVQDEAGERFRAWRARREPRIPRPPGAVCPLCRAPFDAAVRLTDPTVDPKAFFRLACVPEEDSKESLVLKEKFALSTLGALLPVNVSSFSTSFESLWPAWCAPGEAEALREADFLRPGGMLAWLSGHLLELKVQGQLGPSPRLDESAERWFEHFDFRRSGRLTKSELLRGVVKAFDVSQLAAPGTPSRRARSAGVYKLRDLVEAVWDEQRWAEGVPLEDFVGSHGLAERLRAALPAERGVTGPGKELASEGGGATASTPARARVGAAPMAVTVEEALRLARAADFQTVQEDEARAKERAEKQRQPLSVQSPSRRQELQPRPGGAQVLLASLLEAAREEGRLGATRQIRIQCPFCGTVNGARASERHRVICGACRSVFAVPSLRRN